MKSLKHDVTLVAPDLHTSVRKEHTKYYHLEDDFALERLQTFDALHSKVIPGRFAFWFAMRSYRGALKHFFADHSFDVLYARSPAVLPTLLATGMPVVLELHTIPKLKQARFAALCNRCALVVCLTSPMRDALVKLGVEKSRMIVEGDAVNLHRFTKLPSSQKSRHMFHIPDGVPVIGYAGSLVTFDKLEKGVDLLVQAFIALKKAKEPFHGFVVGGPEQWLQHYRLVGLNNGLTDDDVTYIHTVERKDVPEVLSACDVLVYPAPESKHPYFQRDTSPLKLFEYLASKRPIVCADIPPLKDLVSKETVRLFHPGSVTSLLGGIQDVLKNKKESAERVKAGFALAQEHTWKKRMERILSAVQV